MEKTILDKIRVILGMDTYQEFEETEETPTVEVGSITLENGDIIYFDGTELTVDTPVFSDEALTIPVEDGEYVLTTGDTLIVQEGKVLEFKELVEEQEETVDYETKYNEIKQVLDELNEKISSFEKENTELKDELDKFRSNETQLKAEIEKLEAQPSVPSLTEKKLETPELTMVEKRLNALDAIRKLKNK